MSMIDAMDTAERMFRKWLSHHESLCIDDEVDRERVIAEVAKLAGEFYARGEDAGILQVAHLT